MFSGAFPLFLKEMLAAEDSKYAWIINIAPDEDEVDNFVVERGLTEEQYLRTLRGAGPQNGCLYRVNSFACVSETANWSIYCERENDVGVLAVKVGATLSHNDEKLKIMSAVSIVDSGGTLLEQRDFPFNMLTEHWSKELSRNYS